MILDNQTLFSDNQAVTATAPSANIIDLGPLGSGMRRNIGPGKPIPIVVMVTEAFAGLTTLSVNVQMADNEAFTGARTIDVSGSVALADLTLGKRISTDFVPVDAVGRYIRLQYGVNGTATAGRITAGITVGHQTNVA